MELCMLSWFWLMCAIFILVGYVFDQCPSLMPIWPSLFRWGKLRIGYVNPNRNIYDVPKRWFQHFYIVGVCVNGLMLGLVCRLVFLGRPLPSFLTTLLQWLQYPVTHTGEDDAIPVLIVLAMEQLQLMRRTYETFCVNIFSERATMTLLHYTMGIVFYMSVGLVVLTGMDYTQLHHTKPVSAVDAVRYTVAVVVFVVASVMQNQSFRILRDLRISNKKENPQHSGYTLPTGGMFDLVACPHFLAEIIIYIALNIVFGFQHQVLLCLAIFVVINQLIASLLVYDWYCRNFPGYEKKRCAAIPYLL